MSKFIHVNEKNGRISIEDGALRAFPGWVYEVPNNYKLVATLDQMGDYEYIYELLENDERAIVVRTSN